MGSCGRDAAATGGNRPGRQLVGQRGQRVGRAAVLGEHVHLAAGRHQVAGHARVGEEGHRRLGAGQHQMLGAVELGRGGLGEVGEPVDGGDAGAALQPRRECLAQQPGARLPAAIRAAAASPGPRVASPPTMITVGSPDRSTSSTSGASSGSAPGRLARHAEAGWAPSDQDASAGRISVEICEPDRLAAMASAASERDVGAAPVRRTHPETVPASASMSDSSGASYFL